MIRFQDEINKLNIIVLMRFGSHLYGTATEKSDQDYKGIFMPSEDEILLGRIPKTYHFSTKNTKEEGIRNSSEDVDIEIYSLHYFIKLACEGQTVALDMLHAPENMIITNGTIWEYIQNFRYKFYTRNLHAFIGYANRQAAKYGVKGGRLDDAKKVLDFLREYKDNYTKLFEIWHLFPEGEHIKKVDPTPQGVKQIEVCGKVLQETSSVDTAIIPIQKYYENYGERARKAANNDGVDFKAVSHALRAAYQVKELLTEGTITFPLKEADFLRKVKNGELDYTTEVAPLLESLIDEVKGLSEKSRLPDQVDRSWWDSFVIYEIKSMWGI